MDDCMCDHCQETDRVHGGQAVVEQARLAAEQGPVQGFDSAAASTFEGLRASQWLRLWRVSSWASQRDGQG